MSLCVVVGEGRTRLKEPIWRFRGLGEIQERIPLICLGGYAVQLPIRLNIWLCNETNEIIAQPK